MGFATLYPSYTSLPLGLLGPSFRWSGGRCCRRSYRLDRASDRRDLDLRVHRRPRFGAVQQLLLTKPEGHQTLRRNLEGVDQDVADHVGPALAQRQVEVAAAARGG